MSPSVLLQSLRALSNFMQCSPVPQSFVRLFFFFCSSVHFQHVQIWQQQEQLLRQFLMRRQEQGQAQHYYILLVVYLCSLPSSLVGNLVAWAALALVSLKILFHSSLSHPCPCPCLRRLCIECIVWIDHSISWRVQAPTSYANNGVRIVCLCQLSAHSNRGMNRFLIFDRPFHPFSITEMDLFFPESPDRARSLVRISYFYGCY